MPERALHLWAIVPPPELTERIEEERKEFSQNFHCIKALRPPVHITLYQPFRASVADVEAALPELRTWIAMQPVFPVVAKGFGFFDRRQPVVFIDVEPNDAMTALNSGIARASQRLFDLPEAVRQGFHPHFTIGYRDVPKDIFPAIKKAYSRRSFYAAFAASEVSLFRHNGQRWELQYQFLLARRDNIAHAAMPC